MDAATGNAIISGGAALLGAMVGGLTSRFTTVGLHKRQVKKEREDARRDRETHAAKECEAFCIRMADDMEKVQHPLHPKHIDTEREERVDEAYRKLGAVSLYLPTELRKRVESIAEIISEADGIGFGDNRGGPCHYHQPYIICREARQEIRRVVAASLKEEPSPDVSPYLIEYATALEDLNKERSDYYSTYDNDDPSHKAYQRVKEDFYKLHPDLRGA